MQCIHHTAKYIVLDSGLCVLAALVALKRISVFAGALIKKHHYWMSLVPGHTINNQCDEQEVGSVAAVQGDLDVVRYNIWAMKDAGYMTESMGTASRLFYTNDHLHSRMLDGGQTVQFKYTEPYNLHFKYLHLIDDHNNKRHAVSLIEGSLDTQRWAMLVFQFMLAVSEVNLYLANKAFAWSGEELMKLLAFRHQLAWAFILNPHLKNALEKERCSMHNRNTLTIHTLSKCPQNTACYNGHDVVLNSPFLYNQFTCKMPRCKNQFAPIVNVPQDIDSVLSTS